MAGPSLPEIGKGWGGIRGRPGVASVPLPEFGDGSLRAPGSGADVW
ncbi:hypothetical protein NQK81_14735 [Amycolatopsis roodepoortensis]|nr:hypothetical protein [Amycolatopsis roodepoortensis]UUV34648.1 hypothetical protein NQK81_14735 [Amycolatopsis roodepoortensis]